jgi:hypothetical protein
MKTTLTILFLMISISIFGQTNVYHPFPDSNATWCATTYGFNGLCYYTITSSTYFGNDTIINGNSYHTLRRSGYDQFFGCLTSGYYNNYIASIRQDTSKRKVYKYDSSWGVDTILYDFNLQVGDTLDRRKVHWGNNATPFIITSEDSIQINGQFRKRWNFSTACLISPPNDTSIIEGIGGTSDVIAPPTYDCFEYFAELLSFEQNDVGMYPDTSAKCVLIVSGIKNILVNNNVYIYPNPVFDKLNVTLNNNELSEIILCDIASRKVFYQSFTNSTSINTEQLSKGIYLYEVRNKNGVIKKGKVVKD